MRRLSPPYFIHSSKMPFCSSDFCLLLGLLLLLAFLPLLLCSHHIRDGKERKTLLFMSLWCTGQIWCRKSRLKSVKSVAIHSKEEKKVFYFKRHLKSKMNTPIKTSASNLWAFFSYSSISSAKHSTWTTHSSSREDLSSLRILSGR